MWLHEGKAVNLTCCFIEVEGEVDMYVLNTAGCSVSMVDVAECSIDEVDVMQMSLGGHG